MFPSQIVKHKLIACLLVATLSAGSFLPALSAPLYRSTLTMAGLFPWAPNWQESIARSRSLGFCRGRMDFLWHQVERTKGVYNFSFYDKVVSTMAANGMKPVFILAYNNPLYGGPSTMNGISSQANRDAYARFAKAAAAHYKGQGIIWEVWNEPDLKNFWATEPNPHDFAKLAQCAITAIRQGDPSAYVVNGGFAHKYWGREYIRQAMQAGLLRGYNALAVHSYDYLNPPLVIENQESLHNQLRQWMKQYNGGKVLPIVDTEFGARYSWQKKVTANPQDYAAKQTVRLILHNYFNGVYMSSVYGMNAPDELCLAKDSQITRALAYTNRLLGNSQGTNGNYGAKMRGIVFRDASTGQKVLAWWPVEGKQTVTFPAPLKIKGATNVYGEKQLGATTLKNYTGDVFAGPIFFVLAH